MCIQLAGQQTERDQGTVRTNILYVQQGIDGRTLIRACSEEPSGVSHEVPCTRETCAW